MLRGRLVETINPVEAPILGLIPSNGFPEIWFVFFFATGCEKTYCLQSSQKNIDVNFCCLFFESTNRN